MANWNYRVIRKVSAATGLPTYQVHEVYYTEDGAIDCWTQEPVEPLGTSEAQLRNDVHAFLAAFRKPVLEEKLVMGRLQLVAENLSHRRPDALRGEYKSRAMRAASYLFQVLGSHLLLKHDTAMREAYERVDSALTDLCQVVSPELSANAD